MSKKAIKILVNSLISGLLLVSLIVFSVLKILLPVSFMITLSICLTLQIALYVFWTINNWNRLYLGLFELSSIIVLLVLSFIDFNLFNGCLVGIIYSLLMYAVIPREVYNVKENKIDYIIGIVTLLLLFLIVNFHSSYFSVFFISFYLLFTLVVNWQFIFRNHLLILFANILLGFLTSIVYFILFTNSKESQISYIGIFTVLLFVITSVTFIYKLHIFKRQRGEPVLVLTITLSILALLVSTYGVLNSKSYIAYSVKENGITYQINESAVYAIKADGDLEEVNLYAKYRNKPLHYIEGVFEDCKNLKKVTFNGNIIYDSYDFYSLFSKKEFSGSYYCGGYYVPESLKFAVLDGAYTVHDLFLLESIEVVEIKGRAPTYISRYMQNSNISKLICDIDLEINSDFLANVDILDIYAKNGINVKANSSNSKIHRSNNGIVEFVDNCVLFDKTLVQTFKNGENINLADVEIRHLGARSINAKNVLLPESIEGSDLNWNVSAEQEKYFKSKNNDYYFANYLSDDDLNDSSEIIGAGASLFKLDNSINCTNSNVKHISEYAFANNPKLFSTGSFNKLITIGNNAFSDCNNLFEFNTTENLKSIGSEAFKNTSLSTFFIPKSVEYVGPNAFFGSKISTIYLEAESIPENFDKNFNLIDSNGNKINIICGVNRWENVLMRFITLFYFLQG